MPVDPVDDAQVGDGDLGEAMASLRHRVFDAITDDDWERARAGFGDDELASQ